MTALITQLAVLELKAIVGDIDIFDHAQHDRGRRRDIVYVQHTLTAEKQDAREQQHHSAVYGHNKYGSGVLYAALELYRSNLSDIYRRGKREQAHQSGRQLDHQRAERQ